MDGLVNALFLMFAAAVLILCLHMLGHLLLALWRRRTKTETRSSRR